jgi:extracellular factor (EF) 3-hydroxypalmitic acid methyl ester biosynthesis protein
MALTSLKQTRYEGVLQRGDTAIAVELGYASRFSLYASVRGQNSIPFLQEFDHVVVRGPQGDATLGRCVFHPVEDGAGFTGRLIFSDDAYNFTGLFQNETVSSLESRTQKLTLVLAQERDIKDTFRRFVIDQLYELNAYKAFYDALDGELREEPEAVREAATATVLASEAPKFVTFFDHHLEALQAQVQEFNRDEHARHGFYLRKQVWHHIMSSPFLTRTNVKPRGYAGDSEMMRMIYAHGYEGDSLMGRLLHKHPADTVAAQAVRNRRHLIAAELMAAKGRRGPSKERFRAMSVACGPAFEMEDLFLQAPDFSEYDVTLLDQDVEALSDAATAITRVERARGAALSVTYLSESVRTMLRNPQACEAWGKFDFVYSMGLFDYLTEPVARSVAKRLYAMCKPGGTLLIGNYHVGNPTRTYMEYWMDWVLYYRTEDEMMGLTEEMSGAKVEVGFEPSRAQMFLRITKP